MYHTLHQPSELTIDLAQEDLSRQHKTLKNSIGVEPDDEENKQLPQRKKKRTVTRSKALSTTTNNLSTNVNSYLQNMAKLDFSFQSGLSKLPRTQRYK